MFVNNNSLTSLSDSLRQAKARFTSFYVGTLTWEQLLSSAAGFNDTILFPNLGLRNILPITTAKVPIVKFFHLRSGLEVDISLYNTLVRCSLDFVFMEIKGKKYLLIYSVFK